MKKIQMTVVQIDNYGPWTVTPEPRREAELQHLQASLFSKLSVMFGELKGLVFPARYDNMIAITNGISVDDHRRIQEEIARDFPVSISMGIGVGKTAYEALVEASLALQATGGSQMPERRCALGGKAVEKPDEDFVQIVHMDINHSTLLTDAQPIYDTHILIQEAYLSLARLLLEKKAVVLYAGGDNFISAANGVTEAEISEVLVNVKRETGLELKAGIGAGITAEEAAKKAARALHEIRRRNNRERVVFY
ncbi:MAG: GTP cyclohydrolase IIa [Candidatus Hadarchaeales archaeon]